MRRREICLKFLKIREYDKATLELIVLLLLNSTIQSPSL